MKPNPLFRGPADQILESPIDQEHCLAEVPISVFRPGNLEFGKNRDPVPSILLKVNRRGNERRAAQPAEGCRTDRRESGPPEERQVETSSKSVLVAEDAEQPTSLQHAHSAYQREVAAETPNTAPETTAGDEPVESLLSESSGDDIDRESASGEVGCQQLPVADMPGRHDHPGTAMVGTEKMIFPVDGDEIAQTGLVETRQPQEVDCIAPQCAETLPPHFPSPL